MVNEVKQSLRELLHAEGPDLMTRQERTKQLLHEEGVIKAETLSRRRLKEEVLRKWRQSAGANAWTVHVATMWFTYFRERRSMCRCGVS